MCGIWASIGRNRVQGRQVAETGIDAARLRGPDGERIVEIETPCGPLFLGHRRLSVYDLRDIAAQPMQRGPLTAVFNGALYDFKDHRQQLVAQGAQFQTDGDTEVLLEAWLRWGPQSVTRFDGMFAVIVFDARTNTLHLARDRFGEKPLHFMCGESGFAAASEINQFSVAGLLPSPKANLDVVCDFLEIGLAESGTQTFFADVSRVGAGHHQVWDLSGLVPKLTRNDDIFARENVIDAQFKNPRTAAEALRVALDQSVKRRAVADVKIGSCLSGGVDSSAIVRLAAMGLAANQEIECVCAVFDERDPSGLDLSERAFAKSAADRHGVNLHFITPQADDIAASIDQIALRQGEPFAHTSIAVQHAVFRAAHQHGIVVMLDGQGADELFGGYSGTLGARLADILLEEGPIAWRRAIGAFAADGGELDEGSLKRATFNAILPESARRGLASLRGRWPRPEQLTKRPMRFEPKRKSGMSRFDSLLSALVTERSLPGLLRYEDRNSMSFGIESRLPFLSREVADLANQIPASVKTQNGWTKAVLRDAMDGIVPDLVLKRRKKLGFVSPHDRWMDTALRPWTVAGIRYAEAIFGEVLNAQGVMIAKSGLGVSPQANASAFRLASLGHWAHLNHVGV
jgi:asparagine synthase (glutamine-hydrolysing)